MISISPTVTSLTVLVSIGITRDRRTFHRPCCDSPLKCSTWCWSFPSRLRNWGIMYLTVKVGGVDAAFLMNLDLPPLGGIRVISMLCYQLWSKSGVAFKGWYGACVRGSKSNIVNLIFRLFLYHILHTMSLWHHESIYNNTINQQTPPPWWWSRSPIQQRGFDDTTPPEGRVALRMLVSRPLLKDCVWFVGLM